MIGRPSINSIVGIEFLTSDVCCDAIYVHQCRAEYTLYAVVAAIKVTQYDSEFIPTVVCFLSDSYLTISIADANFL